MPRTNHRPGYRIASRSAIRDLTRPAFRVRWRTPNILRLGLACFRKAIQARRRATRLAPAFFDSTVIEQKRPTRKPGDPCAQDLQLAPAKAHASPCVADAPPVSQPLPSARVRAAVERELVWWRVWFGLGSCLFEEFRKHQPYAQVNLHSIALLLEIARDFGHLATGGGINPEPPAHHATFAADLARIYGDKPSQPSST